MKPAGRKIHRPPVNFPVVLHTSRCSKLRVCRGGFKLTFSNTWHKNYYAPRIEKSRALFCGRLVQYGFHSAAVDHLPLHCHAHNFATCEFCAISQALESRSGGKSRIHPVVLVGRGECEGKTKIRRVGKGKEGKGNIFWPTERATEVVTWCRTARSSCIVQPPRLRVKYLYGRLAHSVEAPNMKRRGENSDSSWWRTARCFACEIARTREPHQGLRPYFVSLFPF